MTDHALSAKILRTWYSLCAAYPTSPETTIARMCAKRCHVSIARVLAVWDAAA